MPEVILSPGGVPNPVVLMVTADQETITGETYSSEWLGDTVVSVKGPKKFFKELY